MEEQDPCCPACRCRSLVHWFVKTTPSGHYGIDRCRNCSSAFVLPRPSLSEIKKFYQDISYRSEECKAAEVRFAHVMEHENIYPNSTLDADRMTETCKRFATGARFLDVGAGYGFFSRAAAARGFEVRALEPARSCREVFALMNGFRPDPHMLEKDFVEQNKSAFDVVLLSQVLEHIIDLHEMTGFLGELLGDGGVVAVAVPQFRSLVSRIQGRGDMFIVPPEHLNFFTLLGLKRLFEHHGFEILAWETVSRFDPRKFCGKLYQRSLGVIAAQALRTVFRTADALGYGMYLNLYCRKGAKNAL